MSMNPSDDGIQPTIGSNGVSDCHILAQSVNVLWYLILFEMHKFMPYFQCTHLVQHYVQNFPISNSLTTISGKVIVTFSLMMLKSAGVCHIKEAETGINFD